MSNSDLESYQSRPESYENYAVPRKFVFDVPDDDPRYGKETSEEAKALKRSLEAEKHMPYIFSFPEPKNYKESYNQLVKHIINAYNHTRLLVVEEYFNELKHITREFKVEQPSDCVAILKEILNGCCEKLQRTENDEDSDGNNDAINDYEDLLQKAEAKIRIFIRNEQIFRLNFDILTQKCEDAEKFQFEVQQEIDSYKKTQELLTKENQALITKLKLKDDEIRKVRKDYDSLHKSFKEVSANLTLYENLDTSALIHDPTKNGGGAQSWNKQLLHMLLNENKFTPTETSTRGAGFDPKTAAWGKAKTANGFYPDKSKNERKSTTPVNVNLSNASFNNLQKGKTEKLTNSIISEYKKKLASNRDLLNASLDIVLNKSTENSQERPTTSGNQSQLRSSQGMKSGFSQEKMRIKPPVKERKVDQVQVDKKLPLHLINKSVAMQKGGPGTKYSNASTRPSSTGKSRGSPLVQRNRVVQTEHSPDPNEKSQESGILYTYTTGYGIDKYSGTYAGLNKKKSDSRDRENRENRSNSKGKDKSSLMIQKMIAEQLSKKLGGKKTL